MWYFTADTHFGHANIIKYCKRPFLDDHQSRLLELCDRGLMDLRELKVDAAAVERMDQRIIDSINSAVDYDDHLVVAGDFCLSHDAKVVLNYRRRIVCKNVYLIWGNHDDRRACDGAFARCLDNYTFTIDGQKIFVSHYPHRSWDQASKGSWMLYGHVHNLFKPQDDGRLMPNDRRLLAEGFASVFAKYGLGRDDSVQNELLDVCASINGLSLTLDVGVDNTPPSAPFGTPWSMRDIRRVMTPKTELRQNLGL